MSRLEDIIKKASQKYYEDGSSELSDSEFDHKLKELKKENPNSPILTDVGHGYDIGKDSNPGKRLPHRYGYIQGLTKAYNWNELDNVYKNGQECWCAPKLDGMSIVVYYKDGIIDLALTRGARDGATGIDVTDKVRYILEKNDCILNAVSEFTGAIRGEILMSFDNFKLYCERYPMGVDGKKKPSNPRNTAAGIMNRKEVSNEDLNLLDIIFYHIVGLEHIDADFTGHSYSSIFNMMCTLCDLMNPKYVVPIRQITLKENSFLQDTVDLRDNQLRFIQNDLRPLMKDVYPTDGLVFNHDCILDKETHEIKYIAQAFKFDSEIAITHVEQVEWEMSKTRYAIPTVRMSPVTLAGTTVTFATGFNAQFIKENNIGPGTVVEVEKHGEIIPVINKVIQTTPDNAQMITFCPDCGHRLTWRGVHLICENENCSNAKRQDLLAWVNFLSPLDNFGDKLRMKYLTDLLKNEEDVSVESLMKVLSHTNISTYSVSGAQDILFIEMLQNLISSKLTWAQILQSLNIPRFGEITCEKFSQYSDDIWKLADDTFDIDYNYVRHLVSIIGDANTQSILDNRTKFYRINLIPNLSTRISQNNGKLSVQERGQIAITGTLSIKRAEFEKLCKQFGWTCGELKKTTAFLVTNTPDSNSSKNAKADKFGVKKITELDFRNKYLK